MTKGRPILLATAAVMLTFGACFLLIPTQIFPVYGVSLDAAGLMLARVAGAAVFLLSEQSGGINAQGIVVDAGMGTNYFDAAIVKHTLDGIWPTET